MMTNRSHSLGQWGSKASFAVFAVTVALAGGERAVTPDPASAVITAQECVDNWLDCVDNGPSWGGSDQNGGTTGKPEDPYGPDIGPPEDPYSEGWPEDPYGDDDAAKMGHPEDPYGIEVDPPYRGCLDDGTYYEGSMGEQDLIVMGELTPRQDPTKPFRGKMDDGASYEGNMTEQDLIVMGMLKRHRIPCQASGPGSRRTPKGAMRFAKARAKAKRQKVRQRGSARGAHRR